MYGFIYVTTNIVNNRKYIGKCAYNRKTGWEDYLGSGKILKLAIEKYGVENFSREIIHESPTRDALNKAEIYYINKFDACNSEDYYNIARGGDGGNTRLGFTEEELISYGKKVARLGKLNGMYGKKHTDEAKRKDGAKTTERFKNDIEFKERHRQATIEGMKKVDKEKLKFSNRARNVDMVCKVCGKHEKVYTSQQTSCSECKKKYTAWQLKTM
jgi:group I intron endonuclease